MSDSNPPIVWDSALVFPLQVILVDAAVTCLGYGCFLILAIIAMRVLIQRGFGSTGRRYLLAAVLIFLVSSTVYCAGELAFDLADLALGPYNDNQSAMKLVEQLHIALSIFSRMIYLINDILVIWRAWVVADQPILRIVLAFSMLITIGCTIAEATIFIQAGVFAPISLAVQLLLFIPLIFNNLLATSVVLYKTWIYKTQIKADLGQVSSKSQVESVLFLLIESGFIYCGWWVLFTIVSYVHSVPIMMGIIIDALSPSAAAIYPMLIILVVEHQKSQAEQASAKSFIHSLRFNPPPQHSNGQTGSTEIRSVSIIQSIVDIQSAQRRSSHSAPWRQSTCQVRSTGTTSIIQAIVNIQSARKSKGEGENVENKMLHAPHDNDLDTVT